MLSDAQRRTLRQAGDHVRAGADAFDQAVLSRDRDRLDLMENAPRSIRERVMALPDDPADGVPSGWGWLVVGFVAGMAGFVLFLAVRFVMARL